MKKLADGVDVALRRGDGGYTAGADDVTSPPGLGEGVSDLGLHI